MCGTEPSMHKGENSYMPFFEKEKGHFTARGNVNYTLQCAFHITLSVHACPCLYWMIVRCYSNPHIHLALLDNEDSRASAAGRGTPRRRVRPGVWRSSSRECLRGQPRASQGTHLSLRTTALVCRIFDKRSAGRSPGRAAITSSVYNSWLIITQLNERWSVTADWSDWAVDSRIWCTSQWFI